MVQHGLLIGTSARRGTSREGNSSSTAPCLAMHLQRVGAVEAATAARGGACAGVMGALLVAGLVVAAALPAGLVVAALQAVWARPACS